MNPELVRNAWLELRPSWLWAIPASVAMIVLIGLLQLTSWSVAAVGEALATYGLVLFGIYTALGAFRAAQSVTSELAAGTWEMQRLAQFRPGELLVGKLLGSTILGWYGAGLALGVFLLGRSLTTPAALMALDVVTMLLGALWLHALALFASFLQAGALRAMRRPVHSQMGTAVGVVALLFIAMPLLGICHDFVAQEGEFAPIGWWLPIPLRLFVPFSCAMFLCWTLAGIHRAIRTELQEPVGPWTLLGFLTFLGFFLYPLIAGPLVVGLGNPLVAFVATGAAVFGAALPILILGERFDAVRLRTLVAAAHRQDRVAVITQLPLWTFTFAAWALWVLALGLASMGTLSGGGLLAFGFAAGFGLLLVRDLGIMLALQLAPSGGRNPALVAMAWFGALYVLAPILVLSAQEVLGALLFTLFPFAAVLPEVAASAGAIGLGLALAVPASLASWLVVVPRVRAALRA